jgi:rRNA maturation protein Nop10
MATRTPTQQTFVEQCEDCGDETPHDVSISLVTESKKRSNAEFSREPYRVRVCEHCGARTEQRMNNV